MSCYLLLGLIAHHTHCAIILTTAAISHYDSIWATLQADVISKCDATKPTTQRPLPRAVAGLQRRKQVSELFETRSMTAIPSASSNTPRDDVSLKEALKTATTHFQNELITFENATLASLSMEEKQEFDKLWETTVLELSSEAVTTTTAPYEKLYAPIAANLRGDHFRRCTRTSRSSCPMPNPLTTHECGLLAYVAD